MRAGRWLFAVVMACVAAPAAATDWHLVARSGDGGSVLFIDKDSLNGAGVRQAQAYLVLVEARANGTASIDALVEFDCTTPRRRYLRLVSYGERLQRLSDEAGSGRWADIAPGSVDSDARDFICSDGQPRQGSVSHGSAYPFAAARELMSR